MVEKEDIMTCKIGSIRKIHQCLNADGFQISENALRKWVKEGRIPVVYSGNKAFVSYEKVQEFLSGGGAS